MANRASFVKGGAGVHLTYYNPAELTAIVEEHVLDLTIRVLEEARRTCPVGKGPGAGRLKASLDAEVDERNGRVIGRVFSDLDYAMIVHEGRGPVRARPGKVLGPLPTPYPRFVRRVKAAPGNPWLLNALKTVSPYPVNEGT